MPDLVVANKGSNDVSILLNQAQGSSFTFVPGPRLKAGIGPVATVVEDLNGDGIPDILVANSSRTTSCCCRASAAASSTTRTRRSFPWAPTRTALRRQLRRQARHRDGQRRVERPDADLRLHGLAPGHRRRSPPAASTRWRPSNSVRAAALTTWSSPTMVTASLPCWRGGPMA